MAETTGILASIAARFGDAAVTPQPVRDDVPTAWVRRELAHDVLAWLRSAPGSPFPMLFDLSAVDERWRTHREGQPAGGFTAVYHLVATERTADVRIKVALDTERPSIRTVTDLWPNANWYEREVWDMFGIGVDGHPRLERILMPPWWEGHPLRKEHPSRATEMGPFDMTEEDSERMLRALEFHPEQHGLARQSDEHEYMFLNVGPQHPSAHGVLRMVCRMDGEEILDIVTEIGFHHRGSEKMGERQTWHTYIPYTDRIDYLGGVMNNFPYVLAVEKLAGIQVPDRAKVIRIMLAELFRVISHLVYYGTFAADVGQMSPVFYVFTDREKAFGIVEAITGGRMHPSWFRIGGVAQDLPEGWLELVRDFVASMRRNLKEYAGAILKNRILKARSIGIGAISAEEAITWGATGPVLRACGRPFDLRKLAPYGGYEQFDFDVATGKHGDSYDRLLVHVEEIQQSLRIIEQCADRMPGGAYKADHPLATPPPKARTMHDIETLIDHFLGVSWGPVIPPGEAGAVIEAAKGRQSYYLVSDGGTSSYRTRIRTPSFAHVQMVPTLCQGLTISDLVAILGSIDYVLADVDR